MPSMAASWYRSGFSDRSFFVASVPPGERATMSVNVPPRSIQNCQPMRPPKNVALVDVRLLGWVQGRARLGT